MLSINNNNWDYKERERQVIELYKQGKSTRDIAKELRMSLRDISIALRDNQVNHGIVITDNSNNKSPNQKSTQAYKLFSEGKKPVDVAIQLGLSERQATKHCREYWELKGLHELTLLYEERKRHVPSFLKLHNIMQRQGIDDENDIANVLKYAKELPNLQQYWENIQSNNHNLKCQNQKLERELQDRRRQIAELTEVENMLHQNIDTLQNDIDRLLNERRQLQQFVSRFKNGNEQYLKIKGVAEEHVNRILTEEESLLDLALKAVIEALRMNPDRYAIIYDGKYDNDDSVFDSGRGTTAAAISSSSTPPHSPFIKPYQNYYYNKYHEGILEISKGFLNILLNQLVDKTMFAAIKEK
jgi:DNA-binding CsgD family transcriptional regulator/chorismate mutase